MLGVAPEVLTGSQEAMLSFTGATAELAADHGGPFLVTDIGGGSTEFVLGPGPGDPGGPGGYGGAGSPPGGYGGRAAPVIGGSGGVVPPDYRAISVNIGCVRMTERHLHGDPPTATRRSRRPAPTLTRPWMWLAMPYRLREARTLVGLAGSVTTVAAIAMGLPAYDAARIHHARVCRGRRACRDS